MKLIEVLSKLEEYEIPNKTKFKWRDSVVINKKGTLYCNDMFFSKILNFGNAEALKEELEIIEESKEYLEEIELIDIHYVNDECIFKVYGQSIDETIAIKVNELIANQNKIIRELKDNKVNE